MRLLILLLLLNACGTETKEVIYVETVTPETVIEASEAPSVPVNDTLDLELDDDSEETCSRHVTYMEAYNAYLVSEGCEGKFTQFLEFDDGTIRMYQESLYQIVTINGKESQCIKEMRSYDLDTGELLTERLYDETCKLIVVENEE